LSKAPIVDNKLRMEKTMFPILIAYTDKHVLPKATKIKNIRLIPLLPCLIVSIDWGSQEIVKEIKPK
jgi:hypothetical protein